VCSFQPAQTPVGTANKQTPITIQTETVGCTSSSQGMAFRRIADRKKQAGGPGIDLFRHAEWQKIHGERRTTRMGNHRRYAGPDPGGDRLHSRTGAFADLATAPEPVRGECQGNERHSDGDGSGIELAQRQITETDAGKE
jgi:hypothetical protein